MVIANEPLELPAPPTVPWAPVFFLRSDMFFAMLANIGTEVDSDYAAGYRAAIVDLQAWLISKNPHAPNA